MPSLDIVGQAVRENLREAIFGLRGPAINVARFQVLEKLGAGGMGVVYAAYNPQLDRRVALKLLKPETTSDRAAKRLLREARTLAQLSHPNVISVYDSGTVDGCVYLAMEYVQGATLKEWLASERELDDILHVFNQAGAGLAAAHDAGLVHRDFKPDNVIVGEDGRVRVLDFGLTRDIDEPLAPGQLEQASASDQADATPDISDVGSTDGRVAGTPAYMAPEQWLGESVDARSDLYSFCVALTEAVLGERPTRGTPSTKPQLPSGGDAPPWLRRALTAGLSFEPEERPANMAALLDAIRPPRRVLTWPRLGAVVFVGGAVIGAAALGAGMAEPEPPCAAAGHVSEAVWDDARAQRVRASLSSVDHPYAVGAAQRVIESVGRYVQAWDDERNAACVATHVRGDQSEALLDLRVACLDGRLRDFDQLLVQFEQADDKTLRHALSAVAQLPSAHACADTSTLLSARVDPPSEAQRAAVDALRERLSRVRGLKISRQEKAAAEAAQVLVADAREVGYRPLLAEALFELGRALLSTMDPEGAAGPLDEARHMATAVGDDIVANQAAAELVEASGERAKWDLAELWTRETLAGLERLHWPPELERHARLHIGRMHRQRAQLDEAQAQYERVTELDGTTEDLLKRAGALHALSTVEFGRGQFEASEARMGEALALYHDSLGKDHPSLAGIHHNLGVLAIQRGAPDAAEKYLDQAQRGYQAAYGDDHVRLADVAMARGNLEHERRDFAAAETWFRQALAIYLRHESTGGPLMAWGSIGSALIEQERYDDALPFFERAKEAIPAVHGDDHRFMATTMNNIGELHFRMGRSAEAIGAYDVALRIRERTPDHPSIAFPLHGLGKSHLALGHYATATKHLERALVLRATQPGREHPLATTKLVLASALWDGGGDRARARELAQSARDAFAALGDAASENLTEADAWLTEHP